MRQLINFIKKEFYHVFRDRKTLLLLFGMPIAQIILFGFALTNEIKNSKIVIADFSKDIATQRIIQKIEASSFFNIEINIYNNEEIGAAFRSGKIKLAIIFPNHFNDDLMHLNKAQVQVIADASDPNTATTLTNYVNSIISDYQQEIWNTNKVPMQIIPELRMLYNPDLKGAPNFVPGVMAMVLLLICVMMTSISIVKEKEMGTMEILLVSPFKPLLVIIAKMVPYLFISLLNLCIILLLSVFVLALPIKGSLLLLFGVSTLFIITALSLGLFISTITTTQQAAMSVSMLGMMLPTIILGGYMFPIENMPLPLQVMSNIVPAKWYYIIVKAVMLKGLGFSYIWKETLVLLGMTIFLLTVSLRKFKTRLA